MLLTALANYAETLPSTPAMYGPSNVRWLISIDLEGRCNGELFIPLGGDKANKRGISKMIPHIKRSSGISPKLLADTGEYVLGIPRPTSKPDRITDCHQQFKDLTRLCAESTQLPVVEAIRKFLDGWQPERDRSLLPSDFDPSMVLTFQVSMDDGSTIIPAEANAHLKAIEQFWENYTADGTSKKSENSERPEGWCLISGNYGPVEQRLPFSIKGIPGGQPSGTDLVSANSKAFESYGLANSLTSPISRNAGEAFAKALNHLLKAENSHLRIGDKAVYAWWTKQGVQEIGPEMLKKPEDPVNYEKVQKFLTSPWTGEKRKAGKLVRFFCVALTANNARAVVQSWVEMTLTDMADHLAHWFTAQQVISPYGDDTVRWFSLYTLAACAYRDANKEMLPRMPTALFFAAIQGKAIPDQLLASVVRRIRVDHEHKVTHPRAALIKLYLTFKEIIPMTESMEQLNTNPNFKDPLDKIPYHCGRLLAQLEQIQRTALGTKINATLVDRYYGAMSTTPGKVMGILIQGAQAHLSKIRKNKPGAHHNLQLDLEEIFSRIQDNLPNSFTMQQQSIFALGYYHQRAQNTANAKSRSNKG